MVVKLEGHLHVEADELRQVTMGVGVLGTKYTTDGENLAKTAGRKQNIAGVIKESINTEKSIDFIK